MSEQLPFMVSPYSTLAGIYNRAGLADYARQSLPRYIAFAQSLNWAGRRVLDVGCGTGVTTRWLSRQGYRVVGIDNNPHMLSQAQLPPSKEFVNEVPEFVQMDMRHLESPMGPVDLVVAVGGAINAIQSLRDLETMFSHVNQALQPDHMFIFDARTIRGLANELGDCDMVFFDNGIDLTVTIRNRFSFETLSSTRHYTIWQRQDDHWQRHDEIHIERGYPTQGIMAMLERTGFEVAAVLGTNMEPFDIQADSHARVVFVAINRASG